MRTSSLHSSRPHYLSPMHSGHLRALLYSSTLALLLLAFPPPKPWIVFPKVWEQRFGFSFWMSVISTFFSAIFTSSVDFIKLLFPPLSASLPFICPRVQRVLLSSGPSVLNPLQSKELSFPSGLFDPRSLRGHREGQARAGQFCTITVAAALRVCVGACAVMPSCAASACISALALTPSSPNLHAGTGRSCLHTSCFAHLGTCVKMCDCAQLAALPCLHASVNPLLHSPFKRCPKCP